MMVRSYFNALLCFAIQLWFIYYISLETSFFTPYAGQPRLCEFGDQFEKCAKNPRHPNCVGPAGSVYTKEGVFADYDTWSTRKFVKDSLLRVTEGTPLHAKVASLVDPGEYGIESLTCRMICHFVFALGMWGDLVA